MGIYEKRKITASKLSKILKEHERWIAKALVGASGGVLIFWLPSLAFAAGFGAWQQIKLPKKIYQYISEKCNNY